MKFTQFCIFCLASLPAILLPREVEAAIQYATSSSLGGGWSNGATGWGAASGGPYSQNWTTSNEAVFEGVGGAVTVGAASANSLTFNSNGYVLSGGTITMGSPTGGPVFTVGSGLTATINSNMTPSNFGLEKTGTGTLELGGNVTYSGAATNNANFWMQLDQGVLRVTGGTHSNPAFIVMGSAADSVSQTFEQTGGTFTQNNTIYVGNNASAGANTVNFSGGTFTASGQAVNFAERATATMTVSGSANVTLGAVTANGQTGEVSRVATVHLNGGTLTAASFSNTGQNGSTFVFNFNGGTLRPATNNATLLNANTTTANVRNGGAIIDTNGQTTTIAEPLVHSTIGGDNATDGGLTKIGTGTLILSGASTYNGGTTISRDAIFARNNTALGSGAVVLGNASTGANAVSLYLDTNRTSISNAITISSLAGGVVTLGSRSTIGGSGDTNQFIGGIILQRDVILDNNAADRTDYRNISGAGNVTITGTGRTIFDDANSFVGNLTISTTSTTLGLQLGANFTPFNAIPDTANVTISSGSFLSLSYTAGGSESINGLSGSGTVQNNGGNSNTLIVGASNGGATFGGVIQNGGGNIALTKSGSGTQILTGTNTYTGATTISNGTLQIGDGGTTGALSASSAITNNAALVFNRSNTVTQGTNFGTISGSGSVTQNGVGTLILANTNSYSGATTVNAGILQLNGSQTGSTLYVVNSAGSLTLGASDRIANTATLRVDGGSYSQGAFNETIASAQLWNNGQITSTSGTLTASSSYDFRSGSASAKLAGAANAAKTTGGTVTLTGANTYSGTTTISAGTLFVNNTHTSGGLYTINGGTLGGVGTISAGVVANSGGHVAPGNSPGILTVGSLTMNSGSFFDVELGGATVGSYDRLVVTGAAALGDATLTVSRFGGYMPAIGETFFILTSTSLSGDFDGLANDTLFLASNYYWLIRYNVNAATNDFTSGSGNDVALRAMINTVPEPSSLVLGAIGALIGAGAVYRHKRRIRRRSNAVQ